MPQADDLAMAHTRAFAGQSRGWSADEFEALLASPHVFLIQSAHGFALTRVVADEAELLTLAADPDHRRKGVGRALLAELEDTARNRDAAHVFLEVSAANSPAQALYAAAGYVEVARREQYYQAPDGTRHDALILQKQL